MFKKILLIFISLFTSQTNANEMEIDFYLERLKASNEMPVNRRYHYLNFWGVPFPYPNMHMQYMTPEDSLDLFRTFILNNWDDNKSLQENWRETVEKYNKTHHSLPIPIPK